MTNISDTAYIEYRNPPYSIIERECPNKVLSGKLDISHWCDDIICMIGDTNINNFLEHEYNGVNIKITIEVPEDKNK